MDLPHTVFTWSGWAHSRKAYDMVCDWVKGTACLANVLGTKGMKASRRVWEQGWGHGQASALPSALGGLILLLT